MNLRSLFVKKHIEFLRCPQCHSLATLKKSRSEFQWDRILKAMKFRYYSCLNCGFRKRYFIYKLSKNGIKIILLYAAAMVFTAFFIKFVLTRFFR